MKKDILKKALYTGLGAVLLISSLKFFFHKNVIEDEVHAESNVVSSTPDTSSNIDNYLSEDKFNGIAITVENNKMSSAESYGYSNYEEKEVTDLDTLFPVASLQKMMTATLVAKAVSEGKLSYDTPLSDFYPDIDYSSDITIRDLLNQTSGIKMDEVAPETVLTTQEEQMDYVLNTLESTGETDFGYTNANYSLLAGILSTVTGKSYEELFTEQIIQPLNLSNTYFWDNVPEENVAIAYDSSFFSGPYKVSSANFSDSKELYSSLIGAGNVIMSGNDLVTYLHALTNGTLLTKEEFNELLTTENGYGGAFWQSEDSVQTNGSLGSYQSSVLMDKNGENMTILISNGNGVDSLSDLASNIYEDTITTAC